MLKENGKHKKNISGHEKVLPVGLSIGSSNEPEKVENNLDIDETKAFLVTEITEVANLFRKQDKAIIDASERKNLLKTEFCDILALFKEECDKECLDILTGIIPEPDPSFLASLKALADISAYVFTNPYTYKVELNLEMEKIRFFNSANFDKIDLFELLSKESLDTLRLKIADFIPGIPEVVAAEEIYLEKLNFRIKNLALTSEEVKNISKIDAVRSTFINTTQASIKYRGDEQKIRHAKIKENLAKYFDIFVKNNILKDEKTHVVMDFIYSRSIQKDLDEKTLQDAFLYRSVKDFFNRTSKENPANKYYLIDGKITKVADKEIKTMSFAEAFKCVLVDLSNTQQLKDSNVLDRFIHSMSKKEGKMLAKALFKDAQKSIKKNVSIGNEEYREIYGEALNLLLNDKEKDFLSKLTNNNILEIHSR